MTENWIEALDAYETERADARAQREEYNRREAVRRSNMVAAESARHETQKLLAEVMRTHQGDQIAHTVQHGIVGKLAAKVIEKMISQMSLRPVRDFESGDIIVYVEIPSYAEAIRIPRRNLIDADIFSRRRD